MKTGSGIQQGLLDGRCCLAECAKRLLRPFQFATPSNSARSKGVFERACHMACCDLGAQGHSAAVLLNIRLIGCHQAA